MGTDAMRRTIAEQHDEIATLKKENDKLREFSKLTWQVITYNVPLWVWKDMEADARELGIEVRA